MSIALAAAVRALQVQVRELTLRVTALEEMKTAPQERQKKAS